MEKNLSDDMSESLKVLSDDIKCSDKDFKLMLETVHTVLKTNSIHKFKDGDGAPQVDANNSCAITAVLVLLTEACRRGLEKDSLSSLLKDHDFSSKREDMIMKLFESVKPAVTLELDSIRSHISYITGSNWSLNYCVKDSGSEHVNALEFLVDLNTEAAGGAKDTIQFTCSVDEMQDFVAQLREALKHTEKMASS